MGSIVLLLLGTVTLHAQHDGWSYPVEFARVSFEGSLQTAVLVNDMSGILHAFWPMTPNVDEEPYAVYHRAWVDGQWTDPVDVVLASFPFSVVVDHNNMIHLFWQENGTIRRSMVHATQAGNAHNWTAPDTLPTKYQAGVTPIGVEARPGGGLYLAYGDSSATRIQFMATVDGAHWEESDVAADPANGLWLVGPTIAVAPNNDVLLSWKEVISEAGYRSLQSSLEAQGALFSGYTLGVYYSRSVDQGTTWDAPQLLQDGYYGARFATVGGRLVRLVGGGLGVGGRLISFSPDSGYTWSEAREIGIGGAEGMQGIGVVEDSAGNQHFMIESGMSFAQVSWDGETWSDALYVLPPAEMEDCCITGGQVTENAVMGITEGNLLHVIFEEANSVLWYAQRRLDTPTEPVVMLPTPAQALALAASQYPAKGANIAQDTISVPLALSEQKQIRPGIDSFGKDRTSSAGVSPLFVSVAAPLMMLLLVFAAVGWKRNRRDRTR